MFIRNACVLTMQGKDYPAGDVRFEGGKILAVGEGLAPQPGEEVVDARGRILTPGIVDAHCHIGMFEDGMGDEGEDGNEMTDPVTPQLRAIDAINPVDYCFEEARLGGVTTVVTGPGSANVLGGQFAALKTYGESVEEMLIDPYVAAKAALGENPKRVYRGQKRTPSTRMATASILREALFAAKAYALKLEQAKTDESKRPDRDAKMEALLPVLERKIPLKIHAHRADDIQTAIRIAKEFNLRYTLDHCTEGYRIPGSLRESGARIIVGPLVSERCKIELRNLTMRAPGILESQGIEFAIMTDHPVIPIQYLPVCAGLAVRDGLSEAAALRAITINAAKAAGIEARVGSIAPGKDADLVLWEGHPLDSRARVAAVWIDGRAIPLQRTRP